MCICVVSYYHIVKLLEMKVKESRGDSGYSDLNDDMRCRLYFIV